MIYKIINLLKKEEDMCEIGVCEKCILSWEQHNYYEGDCDCGCMATSDIYDMNIKPQCFYPNWAKKKLIEKHNKREEEFWKGVCEDIANDCEEFNKYNESVDLDNWK